MVKIKGYFVSTWDDGVELSTPATFNGETIETEAVELSGVDILQHEEFVTEEGEEMDICSTCHEGIIKTHMKTSKINRMNYDEVSYCTNPDCEDHE